MVLALGGVAAASLVGVLLWLGGKGEDRSASRPPPRDRAHVALPAPPPVPPAAVESAPASAPQPPAVALPAWKQHAVRVEGLGPGPLIAVVIDDLGSVRASAVRTINLPAPLTLAFLPYVERVEEQAMLAVQAGHEVLVHLPMEPESAREDPGPEALMLHLTAAENLRRLRWALDRLDGYVGINNHMGSRYSADAAGMDLVMHELKSRGLLFLDSRTSAQSVGQQRAERAGVPSAERNIFLDNQPDEAHVRRQLAVLESEARRRGYAVAIGHPHPGTLDALERWLPTVRGRGFQLVPISTVVDRRIQLAAKP